MKPSAGTLVRTVAFGDLDAGVWGAAVATAAPVAVVAMLGAGAAPTAIPAQLSGSDAGEAWELTGAGLSLRFAPHDGQAVIPDNGPARADQVCHVTGTLALAGGEQPIDCLGIRTSLIAPDLGSLDSMRQVLAWFDGEDGIALSALRPSGAKGHDKDTVLATVIEPDGPTDIDEGRLSTTYSADGRPSRVGLELWPTEDEEQFPRRVSGEALGVDCVVDVGGATVGLHAFVAHSRGVDGGGAYLVTRPR